MMWTAVLATYIEIMQRIARRGFQRAPAGVSSIFSIGLCLAALVFKVAFTRADAPELLTGWTVHLPETLENTPLVTQARTVFLGLAVAVVYTIFFESRRRLYKEMAPRACKQRRTSRTLGVLIMTQRRDGSSMISSPFF